MQLNPRYGTDPLITLDGTPGDIATPAIRQSNRLNDTLARFDADQWAHPSRCEGWSNRDVIVHLDSAFRFWAFSIACGLKGEPTQFLATFDPVATPAELVAASTLTPEELLGRFSASQAALAELVGSLDGVDWSKMAEAAPGHLSISAVVHHALWDAWVHERDVLLPLGITPVEEPDEVAACLRYAAALSPAYVLTTNASASGILAIDVTGPDLGVIIEISDHAAVRSATKAEMDKADLRLTGDAVQLLEALSIRGPLDQPIPPHSAWMIGGMAEVFEQAAPTA